MKLRQMLGLPRISLAAKYRLLFGVAVALIIGAALYVPGYRMEALVLQQPFLEAQRAADDYFRLALCNPGAASAAAPQHPPLIADRAHSEAAWIPAPRSVEEVEGLLAAAQINPFVGSSFRSFLRRPTLDWRYESQRRDGAKWFAYSHAVRMRTGCLDCHSEGKPARPYTENQLAGLIRVDVPAPDTDQQLVFNRLVILAAGLLAGTLAILVFYLITHRFILSPIDELKDVAARVSEGDLTVRSQLRTGDEFEQLSESLNTMLERLRAAQDDLKRANRLLDDKLVEMAASNVALFESNRLKSDFLANVSHELRTPLTSIIGFAELLREGPDVAPDGRQARFAENILISGRILLEIINDLLDLAKIEAGKVELHLQATRLEALAATLLDFMRPQADKRGLQLELLADETLPILITDPGRVRQVLFNLLSNAVKFTPDGGSVRVSLRRESDGVRIEVTDTGPGISLEHQQMIFDKFRQVDQSATREHPGTGLGLAIAKELTALLGGEIGVVSELGAGSTFWLHLPKATPETAERRPASLV